MKLANTIAILGENRSEFKLIKKEMRNYTSLTGWNNFLAQGNYRGNEALLLATGVGQKSIKDRMLKLLADHQIDFVIFIGFVGGVEKKLEIGDLVIPQRLISSSQEKEIYYPSAKLIDLAQRVKIKNRVKLYFDQTNLTVDRVYSRNDKVKLQEVNPDVSSVDMEAFEIARICSQQNVPFMVVKAVSDKWDFSFPNLEFLGNSEGQLNWKRLPLYCLRYPKETINLISLIKNCRKAMQNNLEFLNGFLEEVRHAYL